jgi:hypothetical protein
VVVLVLVAPLAARADTTLDAGAIKAMLRTAAPEDMGFIQNVVNLVNHNKLPADLVQSTLLWAKKQPVRHPFQYFKRALIARANDQGIALQETGTILPTPGIQPGVGPWFRRFLRLPPKPATT